MKRDVRAARRHEDVRARGRRGASPARFRRLAWLAVLPLVTLIGGLLGLPAQATIRIEPNNVAVPCPPGTRFVFRRFSEDNHLVPGIWTIIAIAKSGKIVNSEVFDPNELRPGRDVFTFMVELCDELSQPGASAALVRALVATGLDPSDVVLGDFNGDGLPDLAIANQGSNNVSVALGTPGGGFGPTVNFPAGTGPVRIAVGDFNGDGAQDLITANIGTGLAGNLTLLLGNGDGTFQAPIAIAAGILPVDLVVGDWNGDGHLDLAVADSSASAVVVLLGTGGGSFQPPVSLPTGSFSTASIVAVDLNGDGKLDLVTNGAIFLGEGNGTFDSPVNFAAGSAPSLVRTGDLNGDGKPDLLTASNAGNIVSVHLGTGDGTVQPARHYVTGSFPFDVALFDVDHDGALDLVVSNANDDHASVLYGRGEGTFVASSAYLAGATLGSGAFGVAVADFTGDGVPDVLTSDVALLPGIGFGRFGPAQVVPGVSGSRVVAADWNGDDKMDFALTSSSTSSPGTARIALGNGNGTFGAPVSLPLPAGSSSFARFPLVADVNGDGKPDLVVANPGANSLSVFLNAGDGSFNAPMDVAVGKQPTWLAAGDFNDDGKVDLLVANNGDFGHGNGSIEVLLGNGDGTFTAGPVLRDGVEPDSVAAGDVDGDGCLDVVAVVQSPAFDWNLNVFLGNCDGTFRPAAVVALSQDLVAGVRLADLDLDGHLDVIVSLEGTKVGLLRNRGNGTFEAPVLFDAVGGQAVVADLNGDRRPDLVFATQVGL
ncbi:MAG TPA: VCBS repeat-containing protein, partial [Candidatus Methylomirabilis sp.]|nr:VCBS repeat-containing protein [Candidatus Methylomirabilis sp.]